MNESVKKEILKREQEGRYIIDGSDRINVKKVCDDIEYLESNIK